MDSKYFKISNEYQDAKCRIRIPGQAGQILTVIERLTFGWNKKEAIISYKKFRKMTGMNDWSILRSKKTLIKMNIINTLKKESEKDISYRIQTDYTKWKTLSKKSTLKKESEDPLKKVNKTLSKKRVSQQGLIKDINIKDKYKYSKSNKIEQLKLRKKDLQDDLKKKDQFENKEYLIKGIKKIEKQLKKLGG